MSNDSVPELESVDDKSIDENIEIESETESSIQDGDLSTVGSEIQGINVLEDGMYNDLDNDSSLDGFEENTDIDRLGGLLSSVLASEEGETICSVMENISRQLEIHNKIMIKILSHLQKQV
tara:strand:+ start:342 stop:704 length:363 start_codon:yes stop_codon:yes gene_type:complete